MSCNPCIECFCATLPRCPETITIDSDFTPDEALTLEIEDKFGNKYRIEDTAVYAGSALFSTEDLPEGLLYEGVFTFRLFSVENYVCEVPRLTCGDLYCITVTIENVDREPRICCDDAIEECCPRARILFIEHDHELDLDVVGQTQCEYIIFMEGDGTLNLPSISDIAIDTDRIKITIFGNTGGTSTITPAAEDSIPPLGNGVPAVGAIMFGLKAVLTVAAPNVWDSDVIAP